MILAPILGAVGLTLVTVSHLIPIAMGYSIVPAYMDADPGGKATLGATADTFAAIALVSNAAGNFLNFGVVAVRGGHPYYARAAAVDRLVWPARRGARWLAGAAQPGVVGDLGCF